MDAGESKVASSASDMRDYVVPHGGLIRSPSLELKHPGLFNVVKAHYKISNQTLKLCKVLKTGICHARVSKFVIIQDFDKGDFGGRQNKSEGILKEFEAGGIPIIEDHLKCLKRVYESQISLLDELQAIKAKIVSPPPAILTGIAASSLTPTCECVHSLSENELKRKTDITNSVYKWAYIGKFDLENIQVFATRCEDEIKSIWRIADSAIGIEAAVIFPLEEMKEKLTETMGELIIYIDNCIDHLNTGREKILEKIFETQKKVSPAAHGMFTESI